MKKSIKNKLAKGPVSFKFRKQDGTLRKMKATTNPELIPGGLPISQRSTKVYTVYDLDKKGFRNVSEDVDITLL